MTTDKLVHHNAEKFDELITLLEDNGYQIAYDTGMSATIIKEVDDEQQ